MRQLLAVKNWAQYYLPVTLLLFLSVTIERVVATDDGGYDRLYGFPFAFRSNAFACSFCYEFYTDALLSNLALDLLLTIAFFKILEQFKFKLKPHKFLYLTSLLIILFFIIDFLLMTLNGFFKWHNNTPFRLLSSEFKFWKI